MQHIDEQKNLHEKFKRKKSQIEFGARGDFTMSESTKECNAHSISDYAKFHRTQLTSTHLLQTQY